MIVAEWSFSIPNIFCSIPIHVKVLWKTLNTLSGKCVSGLYRSARAIPYL